METTFSAEPEKSQKTRSCLPWFLYGCLAVFLLMILVCGGGGYYLYLNGRSLTSNMARKVLTEAIEQSDLSEEDKAEVLAQLDRVTKGFEEGEVSFEELGKIMISLSEGPLMPLIIVFSVEQKYVLPSDLSDEEKEAARLTLQRVARGIYEEQIATESLDSALDPISTQQSDGERQLKDQVTTAELKKFLEECKRLADEAGIPEEPMEVNIGQEFKKAIDEALGAE